MLIRAPLSQQAAEAFLIIAGVLAQAHIAVMLRDLQIKLQSMHVQTGTQTRELGPRQLCRGLLCQGLTPEVTAWPPFSPMSLSLQKATVDSNCLHYQRVL